MSRSEQTSTDGSAAEDSHELVLVDRQNQRYRWACPNGHFSWDRTNSHIWCKGCRRQAEAGDGVDPEHYQIHDRKEDRYLPWSAVVLADDLRRTSYHRLLEEYGAEETERLMENLDE